MIAGIGMGNVVVNMLAMSISIGLNSALETLVSQAKGSNDDELCSTYLNRSRLILALYFIPLSIIFSFTNTILVGLD